MEIDETLRNTLGEEIIKHNLAHKNVAVRCSALSSQEAIGSPEHDDYPIVRGKELIVEAVFKGCKGHAFSDEFEHATYQLDDLVHLNLDTNSYRAHLSLHYMQVSNI